MTDPTERSPSEHDLDSTADPAIPLTREPSRMIEGEPIELHVAFNDTWSQGFEVAVVLADGYRVRRTDDRALLPEPTSECDVRPPEEPSTWSDPTIAEP